MTRLGVNVDHVATVRQARRAPEPDPVTAALLAELAGADGITVHLRGDRRHIRERDVRLLREVVTTRLNLEMAITEEMLEIATRLRPNTATLVPETDEEVTTEGGLDVMARPQSVRAAIRTLEGAGMEVSLFIDPDLDQLDAASRIGAGLVELNTAAYAEAVPKGLSEHETGYRRELDKMVEASEFAGSRGIRVLAGHGLTYRNVRPISRIPQVEELNIGHNIVARATLVGMERAVREMLGAMNA
ncbi:MAG: pyridoxine 5'-phosphate synthase [Candidatus Aminicenantes bacterium]|nr:pyridoxine 5'-phosphate synthase [Candidatus Aminicenantes bacterium]